MTNAIGWLGEAYPWVKAAHLIVVIFWIAGLFMLPRFMIYQCETLTGSPEDKAWTERVERLRRIIINPSMILVWILGLSLAFDIGAFDQGWFHAKFALVIALSGYHGWAVGAAKKVARGHRPASTRALRIMNEIPSIATILIVILVIVKPF
ncbi:CopD family protein [Sphingomonas sp. CGMCC 1.13654]|uniref:Protoporphyrinogen IX oxidase n=1 Tax=Sphingomonas chungangi TaxID=2683589 RepID=A0A838L9K9_9SPHN|nr:CopD family protein [Sphingomonas chungangi]MBA2935492.1 CopD family protein [Sphingomonas chungangi]MVW56999.1 CopD family protein [Sphingomonas chungangi]